MATARKTLIEARWRFEVHMTQQEIYSSNGAYDAIVRIDGSKVVAEDPKGNNITSGIAGKDDANVIESLFAHYPHIVVTGAFSVPPPKYIHVTKSNISIKGIGATFNNIAFYFHGVNGLLVEDLLFTGSPGYSNNIILNCNDVTFNRVKVKNSLGIGNGGISIHIPPDTTNYNHYYNDCIVTDGNKHGFVIWGQGAGVTSRAQNFHFNRCEAHRCGLHPTRVFDYIVGFDLSETIIIDQMIVSNCKATYSWESGFHMEFGGIYNDVIFENCYSDHNGKKPVPMFGCGFLVGATQISNCVATNTHGADGNPLTGCGIKIVPTAEKTICTGNITEGNTGMGICVSTGSHPCIISNNISLRDYQGMYIAGPSSGAASGAIITGNEIHDPATNGIYIYNAPESIIYANIIRGGTNGIDMFGVDRSQFANNQIIGFSASGIRLRGVGHRVLSNRIDVTGTPISLDVSGHVIRSNSGYVTDNSGSSIGTGSEQAIPHVLSVIPEGCRAWIKYRTGARYITETIPFDAMNVYPNAYKGVAYEWRIE